ncbi:DHA2 family efflux MFS transporter permease subunit [Undibacterium terreum]|uniref:EmrB/QacA family drug resistance transporter n=1 Tax=Undibacterium terreum TaxID=1224302 RepID=A0A916X9M5_9BURK|nr:DHA2 family efflux MFS transporter permease subunit [Undibacterium terreum]GGC57615.1 EmrB/QacA family drug resistance transporter [Undibacterium terreum]
MSATSTAALPVPPKAAPAAFPAPPTEMSTRDWIAMCAGMLGAFMAILDIQITNSSLKDILGSLSATQEEGSWVSTAYLVAEIIVIPLTGLLSRGFGLRRYMLGTTAVFLTASALCGNAWSLNSMIAFRVIQGFSGGALIPMAMTLVLTRLPVSKRTIGMALFGLTATLAPSLGPTVGGYLSEIYGWPSIFYVNMAPGLLMLSGIAYGLRDEGGQLKLFREADWTGIFCMAIGLGGLTVMLEEGNSKDWFDSSYILVCAALAIAGLLGWVLSALLRPSTFVNLRLFATRNFRISTVMALVTGMGLYGSTFVLPIYLAQIAGYSPMQIGEVIMLMGLPQLLVTPIVARLSTRLDNRIMASFGLTMFGISCLINAYMDANVGYTQLILPQVVRAIGQPFLMLTLQTFVMQGVAPRDVGSASSLFNMTRNLGGSIGIAMLATMLTQRTQFHWSRIGEAASSYALATQERLDQLTQSFVSSGIEPSMAAQQATQMINNLITREASVMAFNDCFWIMGVVLIGCVPLVWMFDRVTAVGGGGGH